MQASIPVFTFGGDWATFKKAKADLSVADYSLIETRSEITRKVINAYSEWYKSYLKCLALEYAVKQSEDLVKLITRRYEAGIAPLSERNLGVSRLEQARADLKDQLTNEKKSLVVIAQLIGQPVSRADLVGSVAKPLKPPTRDEILNNALEYNPTVNKVKQQAESSEQSSKIAVSQALPQISFQALRQIGNSYAPGYPGYNALGLVLQYQGGGGFSGVATAYSAYDKSKSAAILVETSKRDLITTINTEFDAYESGLMRVKSLTEAESLTISVFESYDRQYMIGKKGWIDLLNSIRETVIAKSNLADAKANFLSASWRLITYSDGNINWDDVRK
jgi:adhesin transport system outer membrane protein